MGCGCGGGPQVACPWAGPPQHRAAAAVASAAAPTAADGALYGLRRSRMKVAEGFLVVVEMGMEWTASLEMAASSALGV